MNYNINNLVENVNLPALMNRQQIAQAREISDLWSAYGPALRARLAHAGGMTWKTVNKAEYLCRYWQDGATGKKKFTSLGRRSPATEAEYRQFTNAKAAALETIAACSDAMTLAGRLAKAHGLARMPSKQAQALREVWLAGMMDDRLLLLGAAGLFAYEMEAATLAPSALVKDPSMTFLVRDHIDDELVDGIVAVCQFVTGETAHRSGRRHRVQIETEDESLRVVLLDQKWILDRFPAETDREAEVLQDAFHYGPTTGVVIARDSKPVEVKAPDPRAYAIMTFAMCAGRDAGPDLDRARYAAAIVQDRWPETFDRTQRAAFPALFGDADDDGFRLGGP